MDYVDPAFDPLRRKVDEWIKNPSAHSTRPVPTAGVTVWNVKCPYCAVVIEWTSRDGNPPVQMLRHDLFTHVAAYHATVTGGLTVSLPAALRTTKEGEDG